MTFEIPKSFNEFAGLGFDELLPVEFNDIDMDRMLPQLLEWFIRFGGNMASKSDAMALDTYLTGLVNNPLITGLDPESRRQVLEGMLHACILRLGRKGLKRDQEKIDYLKPVTAAVFRSGLPKSRNRNRHADNLVYAMVREEIVARGSQTPERSLREVTITSLGKGIDFGRIREDPPRYDGVSPVDVVALVALLFSDETPAPDKIGSKPKNRKSVENITLPGGMKPIGGDVLDILTLYGTALPSMELTSQILSVTSLRLFQLPLRFALAFRYLRETGRLAQDCIDPLAPNPLEIYCDFTRIRGSSSEELSKTCVQRDLEIMRRFFSDRLFLRLLYQMDDEIPEWIDDLRTLSDRPFEKLQFLIERLTDERTQRGLERRAIRLERLLNDTPGCEDGVTLFKDLRRVGASVEAQLEQVLVEGLRKRGIENQVKWFWSTGGVVKPYGLIKGNLKARQTWRYQPSDPLLLAMLLSCFADGANSRTMQEMSVPQLLDRLEVKFGVLVDRPPSSLDSPRTRAAASENRTAFLRQLQLLGCFDGLSDDFAAQIVRRPREAAL